MAIGEKKKIGLVVKLDYSQHLAALMSKNRNIGLPQLCASFCYTLWFFACEK